jgi:hypothetical protein
MQCLASLDADLQCVVAAWNGLDAITRDGIATYVWANLNYGTATELTGSSYNDSGINGSN